MNLNTGTDTTADGTPYGAWSGGSGFDADANNDDPNSTIGVEYGTNLDGWTLAVDHADIDIIETDDHYAPSPEGVDRVVVKFKRSTLAPDGELFVRLKVVNAP